MKFLLSLLALATFLIAVFGEDQPEIKVIDGGLSGDGVTTRYWDCCKPSCSWYGNLNNETVNTSPVTSCSIDGSTPIDPDALSGCGENGTAYMCSNQVAWVVNKTLAYGFAAASFTGGVDVAECCSCFLLSFLGDLEGKKFLVQVTNTGGDLNLNQFDLAIPGGGVGYFTQGCMAQWDAPTDGWGERYGGVSSEEQCNELPEDLQAGCKFRFGFMEGASNPNVTFVQVECPVEIIKLSGCP